MTTEKIKILYIDDEEHNLIAFKANFRNDYEVFTATSAVEALSLLEKNADSLRSSIIKPYFSDRFFVKIDRLSKKRYRLRKSLDLREETLPFKALVFAIWADFMKI